MLKILSRITEPTEGYAEIHGRVGSLLEVGTGFHPELTGWENITLNGAIPSTALHFDKPFAMVSLRLGSVQTTTLRRSSGQGSGQVHEFTRKEEKNKENS